ncbi:hypothetical protein HaLaN_17752 [Haematococcus lacustris]|uniref:Uncharacterized protein n=1 Tax=Haematococcus lacustris TaxID=44745 RepID=A0A699ZDB4_HAELA|nr:hypothetical protein HaLaN_17752 [Haematococcus lacustris]
MQPPYQHIYVTSALEQTWPQGSGAKLMLMRSASPGIWATDEGAARHPHMCTSHPAHTTLAAQRLDVEAVLLQHPAGLLGCSRPGLLLQVSRGQVGPQQEGRAMLQGRAGFGCSCPPVPAALHGPWSHTHMLGSRRLAPSPPASSSAPLGPGPRALALDRAVSRGRTAGEPQDHQVVSRSLAQCKGGEGREAAAAWGQALGQWRSAVVGKASGMRPCSPDCGLAGSPTLQQRTCPAHSAPHPHRW